MRKLAEVEDAKALMAEAMDWSVFKWLWEKGRVRETADRANAALDDLNRKVKARWRDDLKAAYKVFHSSPARSAKAHPAQDPPAIEADTLLFLETVKRADERAHRAHLDAEKAFDEAERLLSTSLAVEGCHKAIRSWELHEAAIREAEHGCAPKKATKE